MSRTVSLAMLVSVFVAGLGLVNYAQPTSADTLTQGATQEPPAIPMTRTAEAAMNLILIVILGIGAVLQRLLGETVRNIYFGLLALFVLFFLFAGRK